MQATLHAIDDEREHYHDRPSKGRNSSVYSDDFEIHPSVGELIVTAKESEWTGGGRGGKLKDIRRTLTLWLSSRDIKRIVDAALSAGLLITAVKIAKPKKKTPKAKTK